MTDKALVRLSREAQMEQRAVGRASPNTPATVKARHRVRQVDQKPSDMTPPPGARYGAQLADLMKRIADVRSSDAAWYGGCHHR